MKDKLRSGMKKRGLPPGSLVHVGKMYRKTPGIRVITYNSTEYHDKNVLSIEELQKTLDEDHVTWINLDGIHDIHLLSKLGECFGLHHLVLEDILNTTQRPKIDDYGDYIFFVGKMLYFEEANNNIASEQISLILGKNFVLSFQEGDDKNSHIFDPIIERIATSAGRMRTLRADFLFYSLLDIVVDNYYILVENLEDKISEFEDSLEKNPQQEVLKSIQSLKKQALQLHRIVWPVREATSTLQRSCSELVDKTTLPYLSDVYDHVNQIMDNTEIIRDIMDGIMDIYLSSMSYKMNEVMKVLTIISTVFIPLTFIVGVYGMNFEFMPELQSPWAYPVVWVVMVVIAVMMIRYFRRKKWM